MQTCAQCGQCNEDFFKFCLECGTELEGDAPRSEPAIPSEDTRAGAGAPGAASAVVCGACGGTLLASDRYCGGCGSRTIWGLPGDPSIGQDRRGATVSGAPWRFISVDANQEERGSYALVTGMTTFGRFDADVVFTNDDCLAENHLSVECTPESVFLSPEDTRNGCFMRIRESAPLSDGSEIRIGQELLRYEEYTPDFVETAPRVGGVIQDGSPREDNCWGRLVVVMAGGAVASAFPLHGANIRIGREAGDVTFSHDAHVSGVHATLLRHSDNTTSLTDEGSRNGTHLRVRERVELKVGDKVMAGQQIFRLEIAASEG